MDQLRRANDEAKGDGAETNGDSGERKEPDDLRPKTDGTHVVEFKTTAGGPGRLTPRRSRINDRLGRSFGRRLHARG